MAEKERATRAISKTRNIVTRANLIIYFSSQSYLILYWGSFMLYRINEHYNNLQIHCFGNLITLLKIILTLPSALSDNYIQIQRNDFQRSQIRHGNHSVNIKRQGRREPAEIGDGSEVALYGIQIQILQQSHSIWHSVQI